MPFTTPIGLVSAPTRMLRLPDLDVAETGDAPMRWKRSSSSRLAALGVALEALHAHQVLDAVLGGGEPGPGVALLVVARRPREVGLDGRHLLLAEEPLDVQVARLLEERAHLLVGVVRAVKLRRWISRSKVTSPRHVDDGVHRGPLAAPATS